MSNLYLYSIFHGNLNYSSIPSETYEDIIDTCYWPILDIIKEYKIKPGIEFPVNTIKTIEKIDPLFLEELKKCISNKKCELIFSSKEQTVFPLVPEEINLKNLIVGKKEIEKIFSTNIETAYINEQQFSSGLVPLYSESNIKNVITMWEWMSKVTDLTKQTKFFPKKIIKNSSELNIIWNSYIAYQKFQRYVDGILNKKEYLTYILKQQSNTDSCFPWYGSDMEIFGYKNPVLGLEGKGNEIQRFREILNELEKNKQIKFEFPTRILEIFPPTEKIEMSSAKFAISGKKQDKFVVTRWAACGRDNSSTNTMCYHLFKKIQILKTLNKNKSIIERYTNELIDCWASDYRTHTTEQKYLDAKKKIAILDNKLTNEFEKSKIKIIKKQPIGDIIIYNPNKGEWNNIPYQVKINFRPKNNFKDFSVFVDRVEITSQVEEKKFYKNGSLRSAVLVIEPRIDSNSSITLSIKPKINLKRTKILTKNSIKTENVKISLSKKRGGTIEKLIFPTISKKPLIRFLEHGTFQDTKLSADFYSGHSVVFAREGHKITDLKKVDIFLENNMPIREKLFCDIELPFGHLKKIFYVYKNHSRIDIKYIFNFKAFRPASFRIGIITLNPEGFERETLQCSTHDGGKLETFTLDDYSITQDESSDPRLSSQGCMGATEGIFDFGDNRKGVTIFTDKSDWYSVPLIHYHDLGKKFFFRISNSVSELDDTTMTWWKGRKEISFSILGREGTVEKNVDTAKSMFVGLICQSKNNSIKVGM